MVFDPIHSGHIALIREAAETTNGVIVLLNSDRWLTRKKGRPFMNWVERATILSAISGVIDVVPVDDGDGTVCNGIQMAARAFGAGSLTFCNGGDRTALNTPETALCEALGIDVKWDVGGGKTSSSSELLSQWLTDDSAERDWGRWTVFRNYTTAKLKELIVEPGKSLSMQRHQQRVELWFVAQGEGEVLVGDSLDKLETISLFADHNPNSIRAEAAPGIDTVRIRKGQWHQLRNTGSEPLHIIEIQHGDLCVEEDIERVGNLPSPKKQLNISGKPCPECGEPNLQSATLMDDFSGWLTCKKCGFRSYCLVDE